MKTVILSGNGISPIEKDFRDFEQFGELTIYGFTPDDLVALRIEDAEIVFVDQCKIGEDVFNKCPNIKYIGVIATGYNRVDINAAARRGIPVCNVPAYGSAPVGQQTIALLLSVCNHMRVFEDAVQAGDWDHSDTFHFAEYPQFELYNKTLGMIGFGNIGRYVAKVAEAFGMKVLISSGYPLRSFETDRIKFTDQETVIRESDVISMHCSLTEKSKSMINKDTISRMKDGVIIINTARGALIHEQDLADALHSGKVRGAGLDVLKEEPPSKKCPLLTAKNCIITPHIGWHSVEALGRIKNISIKNLKSFLSGELSNCVNIS